MGRKNHIFFVNMVMKEYQVVGRKLPEKTLDGSPTIYRMKVFAPNEVVAKSRFWYFLSKARKLKKTDGEILGINQIFEKKPQQIKNFGIWVRYNSRFGTHNMYKEYRDLTRVAAVEQLYKEMASRHRARTQSIHLMRVGVVKSKDVRRTHVKQFIVRPCVACLPVFGSLVLVLLMWSLRVERRGFYLISGET